MSLLTDKVFFNALMSNQSLVLKVGSRIENTSIPVPDDQLDNEPVPYIIITFDGLMNDESTKDSSFEGDNDKVQISIEVTANDREELGDLTTEIRRTIISYFESDDHEKDDYDLIPDDYDFSASNVVYDPTKPCFTQTLTYRCDTKP